MTSFRSKVGFGALFGLLISLSAAGAFAQAVTGTISGTVKDSSGLVLPDAQVVLLNEDTGLSRTVRSDAGGRYLAPSLPLGKYKVTATVTGFQTLVRSGIELNVGTEAVVDLALSVGAVTQTVEVTAEAPAIETTNAVVSSLVSGEQVRELPLNGRSLTDLTLLNPGVLVNHASGNSPADGLGPRLSINGGRQGSTLYLLDGTYINNRNGGSSSTTGGASGVESVREFRLLTHNFPAEYGQNSGGVISMVTRSGTNQFHGSLYEFFRNSSLDARDFFDRPGKPPFRQNQFGGAFGGPIKKDRIFFFGNYEGLRRAQSTSVPVNVPDANARLGIIPGKAPIAVNPLVLPYLKAMFPLPNDINYGDGTGRFISQAPYPYNENYYMSRGDIRLSDRDSVYVRYVYNPSDRIRPFNLPYFFRPDGAIGHYATVSETHIFSSGMLNEFRAAFNRTFDSSTGLEAIPGGTADLEFNPGAGRVGSLTFSEGASVGGASGSLSTQGNSKSLPNFALRNVFQTNDSFSWIRGAHAMKFGGDIQRVQANSDQTGKHAGEYTFDTLQNFLLGRPTNLAGAVYPPGWTFGRGVRWTVLGWYIQDDWRVRSNLTLNLGLRHEFVSDTNEVNGYSGAIPWVPGSTLPLPAGLNPTPGSSTKYAKWNFAPRFGLAWDPTGSGKNSVRVGVGVYNNLEQGATGVASFAQATAFSTDYLTNVPNPTFPNKGFPATAAAGGTLSFSVTPWPMATPKSVHFGVDIQRQLSRTFSVLVGYIGAYNYNQTRVVQLNIRPFTVQPDGSYFWPGGTTRRIDTKYGAIGSTFADAVSNYNALQATVRKALGSGLMFAASYTWSKAMSEADKTGNNEITNTGSAVSLDKDNANFDYGRSGFDQRHAITANASYDLPFDRHLNTKLAKALLGGWGIKGVWQYGSGLPLNLNLPFNNSRSGQTLAAERPNVRPGFSNNPTQGASAGCAGIKAQPLRTADLWYDPCAFSLAPAGTWGNLGRNTVDGPPSNLTNFTLAKNTPITERVRLEFRTEIFNLFNHPNFGIPIITVFNPDGTHQGAEGSMTSTWSRSRQIQLGLKLIF